MRTIQNRQLNSFQLPETFRELCFEPTFAEDQRVGSLSVNHSISTFRYCLHYLLNFLYWLKYILMYIKNKFHVHQNKI